MIIQGKKISVETAALDSKLADRQPVQKTMEGHISDIGYDYTKDCNVHSTTESSVYTETANEIDNTKKAGSGKSSSAFSPAQFIEKCMTGEDVKALEDEKTPLEEYTLSQGKRAVSRVKKQRAEKRESIENEVEKEADKREKLEKYVEKNLPESPENMARISHAVNMANEIAGFSDEAMRFFIANDMQVNPENISTSVLAARSNVLPKATKTSNTFSQIQNQVTDILEKGDLEVDESTVDIAKWMYDNNLCVTAENIKKYQSIQALKEMDADVLMERIVDLAADGEVPELADITTPSNSEAKKAIDKLVNTDDQTLKKKFVTEADFLTAKRRLEEIRLRMTATAARSMLSKGIKLDVTNLEKIVEKLRVAEKNAINSLIEETDLPRTEKNIEVFSKTIEAKENVLRASVGFFGKVFKSEETFSLENLSDIAEENLDADVYKSAKSSSMNKAAMAYESVGTEVRKDLGDSLQKAFAGVDDILDSLNMTVTKRNQRAVRILAYNQMEITKDSINSMKVLDNKVNSVMESLKPQTVAKLIKNNLNPLEMNIDELRKEISELDKDQVNEDISFKRFLWKMDRTGEISSEERESMIGIYRLLDKIEKSDGAVIGQIVKENRELSFSSMLSAIRSKKVSGMDYEIDDQFGGLSDVVTSGKSISEQINSGFFSDTIKNQYMAQIAKNLKENILPDIKDENLQNLNLEELLEYFEGSDKNKELTNSYYEKLAEDFKNDLSGLDKSVSEFVKRLNMPDTFSNLMSAKEYLGGKESGYKKLWTREQSDEIIESFDKPTELFDSYEKIDENHLSALEKERENDDISFETLNDIKAMASSISFYKTLRKSEMYEVPIHTSKGFINCNVTMIHEKNQKGTVDITLDSEQFGKVQASFKLEGMTVKGFVTAGSDIGHRLCENILSKFEMDLEENGFTMDSGSLVKGQRNSLRTGNIEGARNKDLYRVAKLFIQNVRRKEDAL